MDNSPLIVLVVCVLAVIPFAAFIIVRHWRGPQDMRVPEALWLPPDTDDTENTPPNSYARRSTLPARSNGVNHRASAAQGGLEIVTAQPANGVDAASNR